MSNRYALIENGRVTDIIEGSPEGRFHPSLLFVETPVTTKVGDLWNQQTGFAPPPPTGLLAPVISTGLNA